MSQAANQVKWCLNHAKERLAKGEKKHRGLLETKPNLDAARKHLEKAEHDLNGVLYMAKGGLSDWAVSAAFYSMYQCMLAIIAKFGYESENQTCTVAMVELLKEQGKISIDDKFIKMLKPDSEKQDYSVINMREEYSYGFKIVVPEKDIKKLTESCKELIEKTKNIVYAN